MQGLEEEAVRRVMQRVQLSLDYRLRRAVNHVLQDHTQQLVAQLRSEVENVVRDAVQQAVKDELSSRIATPRKS